MKDILTILTLIALSSCGHYENKYLIDSRLQIMPHAKGATSRSLAISDFSIARGQEIFFDTIALTNCWCDLREDTLTIRIGYFSESGGTAVFEINGDKYFSYAILSSDVNEYDGSHTLKIQTNNDKLTLSKSKVSIGDTLLGQFELLSDTTKFRDWDRPILFNGSFQCIVESK